VKGSWRYGEGGKFALAAQDLRILFQIRDADRDDRGPVVSLQGETEEVLAARKAAYFPNHKKSKPDGGCF
jgi:hypothetical protein